ncbi:ATPase [Lagierella sp.]|uniref:ATPase n=1 Tax=Lagierella sp. TaxID=2849657 RepID=UPI002603BE28|nr:ATPase [Lagierella sp.]
MNTFDYNSLRTKFSDKKNRYHQAMGEKISIEKNINRLKESLNQLDTQSEDLILVDTLLKETADFSRLQSSKEIENIVTSCLELVFNSKMEFKIELSQLRGKNSAEFFIIEHAEDKEYKYKIEDTRGGGVIDILSLALRISFLLKISPKIEGPIILDEPAKHVSEDYIFNIADFIKKISEEFNKQMIIISHNEHLASIGNKRYRIHKENFESITETLEY